MTKHGPNLCGIGYGEMKTVMMPRSARISRVLAGSSDRLTEWKQDT
ncbi:hypothetical protein TPY_3485 [Sulfobacillus acidophilus TPY]|nr:hypothetical protein TPY_3485 [Sulfobacillus acidophilus TPY]